MPRKVAFVDFDDMVARYERGESSNQIANMYGVSSVYILSRLKERGVSIMHSRKTGSRHFKTTSSISSIVDRYISGESENCIAKSLGVSRNVIRKVLIDNSVAIRDNTEANRLMMSKRTPEENFKNCLAAHAAVKGIPKPESFIENVAKGRERNLTRVSEYEWEVINMLRSKGLEVSPQKAVGRYNIDIAIPEFHIAVEIFGGAWHSHGAHADRFRKRFDYLIDSGWIPIIVWTNREFGNRTIDNRTAFIEKYLLPLIERLRRGKPVRRKEHVISCRGQACARGKYNLKYRASIGGDKCGDLIRGKDGRFTR